MDLHLLLPMYEKLAIFRAATQMRLPSKKSRCPNVLLQPVHALTEYRSSGRERLALEAAI